MNVLFFNTVDFKIYKDSFIERAMVNFFKYCRKTEKITGKWPLNLSMSGDKEFQDYKFNRLGVQKSNYWM